jgi:hypothetical protein
MNNIKSILKIVVYLIIFFSVLGFILLNKNKQYVIDNWPEYRCNPVIMPFAGYFGKDAGENFTGCLTSSFGKFFKILIKPFQFIIKNIQYLLGDLLSQINIVRTITKPIREFVNMATRMIFEKTQGLMNTIMYSFYKINNIMKRLFANFRLMIYTLEASQMTIKSTWDGPIGKTARFWGKGLDFFIDAFCFSPNTFIKINGIHNCKISEVKLGDRIENSVVYGIMKTRAPDTIYQYNKVIVSGNHYVREDNKWLKVRDSKYSKHINTPKNIDYLYSLWTDNHRIIIDNIEFADYEETDLTFHLQKKLILDSFQSDEKVLYEEPNLLIGNMPILLSDLSWKQLSDIEIGDRLYPMNNEVIGKVCQKVKAHVKHGMTTNNIIYNKKWKLLENELGESIEKNDIFYNLIVSIGFFITPTYIVRDYMELHDTTIYERVAEMSQFVLGTSI